MIDLASRFSLLIAKVCYQLSSKSSREDMCRLPTSFLLNIQSHVKQEVDIPQIQNCVTRYSSPYWCSVPNIRKLACVVPEKNVTEIILWICLCPQYSKLRKTGSGHAADSKLRNTIQFSILMLCAKYQEAGLCGSREKCDRNYLLSKFAYVHNIQSRIKQEVDMPQIQNCVTRYSFPY